ncbi:hypothetical protein HK096_001060, partial [Nowakowskiella sp. JEL0078]
MPPKVKTSGSNIKTHTVIHLESPATVIRSSVTEINNVEKNNSKKNTPAKEKVDSKENVSTSKDTLSNQNGKGKIKERKTLNAGKLEESKPAKELETIQSEQISEEASKNPKKKKKSVRIDDVVTAIDQSLVINSEPTEDLQNLLNDERQNIVNFQEPLKQNKPNSTESKKLIFDEEAQIGGNFISKSREILSEKEIRKSNSKLVSIDPPVSSNQVANLLTYNLSGKKKSAESSLSQNSIENESENTSKIMFTEVQSKSTQSSLMNPIKKNSFEIIDVPDPTKNIFNNSTKIENNQNSEEIVKNE